MAQSKKLTKAVKTRLLKSLPRIAEAYFGNQMTWNDMDFGICFNNQNMYHMLGIDPIYAYGDVSKLLYTELGFRDCINLENEPPTYMNWEQRAIMCLFLTEYLKGME